jgi:hypothetical protein
MKKLISIVSIIFFLSLTSCIDIIEEIFLEKNGSGKYLITVDMKSMIAMKDLWLKQSLLGGKNTSNFSEDKTDTVIYFNNMADSVRSKFKHPELLERAFVRITMDEDAGAAFASLEFPFKDVEEVNTLLQDLGNASSGSVKEFGFFGFLSSYKVTKRSIERTTLFKTQVEQPDSLLAFAAAQMFMANARVKTIYHLPGKVKSATIPGAYIRGDECMVEVTYPEFVGRKKSVDGKVVFK